MEYKRHPSHVSVFISRQQTGKDLSLFGSTIYHENYISIKVQKAEMDRSHNSDRLHAYGVPLIEVYMSPIQFANLITTFNYGEGTPGTLYRFNGEFFEQPPIKNKAEQFKNEVKSDVSNTIQNLDKSINRIDELMDRKKPLLKNEKEEIKQIFRQVKRLIDDKLPFVMDQFSKQMDKTVTEAKSSIDAFVIDVIQNTGLNIMRKNYLQIEEDKKGKENDK